MSLAALGKDLSGTVGQNWPQDTERPCLGEDGPWAGYFYISSSEGGYMHAAREWEGGTTMKNCFGLKLIGKSVHSFTKCLLSASVYEMSNAVFYLF